MGFDLFLTAMTVILSILLLFSILLLIVLLILQRYLSYRFEQEVLSLVQQKKNNSPNKVGYKPLIQTNRAKYSQDMEEKVAFTALENEKAKYTSKKNRRLKKQAPHYPLFNEEAEEENDHPIFGSHPTSFLSYKAHAERYIDRYGKDNITNDSSTVILESGGDKKPVDPDLAVISPEELLNFHKRRLSLSSKRLSKTRTVKSQNRSSQSASLKKVDVGAFERKAIDEAIDDYYVRTQRTPFNTFHKEPLKKRVIPNRKSKGEIIDSEEIKNNLLRLRSQRRREKNYFPFEDNATIEAGEVKENLRGSDSPLVRSRQFAQTVDKSRTVRTIEGKSILPSAAVIQGGVRKGVLSSRFTPMDNSQPEEIIPMSIENEKNIKHPSSYGRKRHHFLGQKKKEEQTEEEKDTLASDSEHISGQNIEPEIKEQSVPYLDLTRYDSSQEEGYHRPPLTLLEKDIETNIPKESRETVLRRGALIENKLAEFKVKVKVTNAYAGPVVTRYDIEPDVGVRGNQVINLEKDLARALGCASVRIVDTIPGKTCMGLELPNNKRKIIRLSEIFASSVFQESKAKLTLALGQDITGAPIVTDLTKAPHLLVAGTTGSGKSVGINAMILSLLYKESPEQVRLVMIDPKMLELNIYEGIPHLLAPVVTDMKMAANALMWCVNEMEKRYRIMSQLGVRNIIGYNQKLKAAALHGQKISNPFSLTPDQPEPLERFPYIVVVVDEFADMMMTTGKKVEELIARLAQKARAAGIHLILATQRPSVDVITGLIKASVPSRVSFQVSSKVDSRTILDQAGAENLLGMGDMLFSHGSGFPLRVHGAFVADDEVHRVVDFLKAQGEPEYIDEILNPAVGFDDNDEGNRSDKETEEDPLYDEAVAVVLDNGKASISFVQRALRIGYNRAARLIEEMENSGIVSRPEHNGNRTILVPRPRQEG